MDTWEAEKVFCEALSIPRDSTIAEEARKMIDEETESLVDYRRRGRTRITAKVESDCREQAVENILEWVAIWRDQHAPESMRQFIASHRRTYVWAYFLGQERAQIG